jgi:hypothetical protein
MPVEEEKHGRPRAVVTPHWPHAALAGVHHGEAAWENSFDDPLQLCTEIAQQPGDGWIHRSLLA